MEKILTDLVELHKKDTRIEFLTGFLAGIPEQRELVLAERKQAEDRLAAEKDKLDHARQELKRKERKLEEGEERLEKLTAKVNQVKTNKEYEAVLKEIEEQKQVNGGLEEEILVLYDEVERSEGAKKELEDGWKERSAEFDARIGELDDKKRAAEAALEEARKEREQVAAGVRQEDMAQYDKVRQARGSAVARVDKEICLGCHHHIPAQIYNTVLKGDSIIYCPMCMRVMVHVELDLEAGLREI